MDIDGGGVKPYGTAFSAEETGTSCAKDLAIHEAMDVSSLRTKDG
jgi:hypothetical protein